MWVLDGSEGGSTGRVPALQGSSGGPPLDVLVKWQGLWRMTDFEHVPQRPAHMSLSTRAVV